MTAMAWKTALQLTGVSQALYLIFNLSVSYVVKNVDLKSYITKMFHSPKNYQWMDLNCTDPIHGAVTHFAVCERIPA